MKQQMPRVLDHPKVREERDRLGRVQNDLAAIEKQLEDLFAQKAEAMSAANLVGVAAESYLAGDGSGLPVDVPALNAKQTELDRTRVILREAIAIQHRRVEHVVSQASKELGEQLRPQYKRLLQRVADAVVALGKLADEESEFREAWLEGGGSVSSIGNPAPLEQLRLSQEHSRSNYWLREVERDYGVKVSR